jgi:superfamily I DNA/RNA helicase
MIERLRDVDTPWAGQVELVREWYQSQLERLYDYTAARAGDLDQIEQIAAGFLTRERFLTELTLDPPDASGAEAGCPQLDEDYLILSTIHSAKGQEWDAVFILNLVDGCIPSDMASRKPEQIDRGAPASLCSDDTSARASSSAAAPALLLYTPTPPWSRSRDGAALALSAGRGPGALHSPRRRAKLGR